MPGWFDWRCVGKQHAGETRFDLFQGFLVVALVEHSNRLDRVLVIGCKKACCVVGKKLSRFIELSRREEGSESVVIFLGQWIGFVVMASAAREGQAQECRSGRLGQIGQNLCPRSVLFIEEFGRVVVGSEPKIACSDQAIEF